MIVFNCMNQIRSRAHLGKHVKGLLEHLYTPGVEGQQFGVNQDEGVQHLLSGPLGAAVELLN